MALTISGKEAWKASIADLCSALSFSATDKSLSFIATRHAGACSPRTHSALYTRARCGSASLRQRFGAAGSSRFGNSGRPSCTNGVIQWRAPTPTTAIGSFMSRSRSASDSGTEALIASSWFLSAQTRMARERFWMVSVRPTRSLSRSMAARSSAGRFISLISRPRSEPSTTSVFA